MRFRATPGNKEVIIFDLPRRYATSPTNIEATQPKGALAARELSAIFQRAQRPPERGVKILCYCVNSATSRGLGPDGMKLECKPETPKPSPMTRPDA